MASLGWEVHSVGSTFGRKYKSRDGMHFFIVLEPSAFDAAADLAYKGYRIEHRGFFVSAKMPLKTYSFPPARR